MCGGAKKATNILSHLFISHRFRLQGIHKNMDYLLERRGKLKGAVSHILLRQSKHNSEQPLFCHQGH